MVNHTAKTKTTIVVDSRLLDEFKRLTSLKNGTSRTLSLEFEEAIRAFSPPEILLALAERLNLKITKYPSLDEIARNRPRVNVSSGEVVREMRDERDHSLPGHK